MDDRPFDNPQPIDDSILEHIESEDLVLTDQLFFKLIKETPLYLGFLPFQNRIAQWQYCLNNPLYSDVEQREAKKKLLQIGRTLAYEHKGRPEKIPNIGIHHQYKIVVKEIDKFLQEHKNEKLHERWKNFQSTYPESSKYVDIKRHRTAKEIAFHFIVKKYHISTRSLRTLISNLPSYDIHTDEKTGLPITISKKPE